MSLRIIILFLIFFSNTIAGEIYGVPKIIDGDTVHINNYKHKSLKQFEKMKKEEK